MKRCRRQRSIRRAPVVTRIVMEVIDGEKLRITSSTETVVDRRRYLDKMGELVESLRQSKTARDPRRAAASLAFKSKRKKR